MSTVFHLIYKSTEAYKMSIEELDELTNFAKIQNALSNITGLLIRKNGGFIQYLEGNKADITTLYEKIVNDKRHHTVTLITKGYIKKRKFEKWSMLLKSISSSEIQDIQNNLRKKLELRNSEEINRLLIHELIKTYEIQNLN